MKVEETRKEEEETKVAGDETKGRMKKLTRTYRDRVEGEEAERNK